MATKRYYYKNKATGHPAYNLKEPLANILPPEELEKYEEVTVEEWNALVEENTPADAPVEYVEPTPEQVARNEKIARINFLKGELARTDYEAIKYAEGWFTDEEYADTKAQRQAWRDEINELEGEL